MDEIHTQEPDEIDAARASLYRLLGVALAGPPAADVIDALRHLSGMSGEIGATLDAIAAVARDTDTSTASAEYNALFVGVMRGELVPYASFYLTGYLYDRPLARIRDDMQRLGLAASPSRSDPEDHAATVLEVMSALIARGAGFTEQHDYFTRHLGSWAGQFFTDLETAPSARLYQPIGRLGRLLVDIEAEAFLLESA